MKQFWIFDPSAELRTCFGFLIGGQDMTKTSQTAFFWFRFDNRKPVVSRVEPSAIQNPKWVGLSVIAFTLIVGGVVAHAQQPVKVYRIGFLSGGFPGPSHWTARLRAELQKLGYVEGKNIDIEARFTENKIDRLPGLADELVRLKPDVIVTGGQNDARAAKNATKTIPIVGTGLGDPIANGLVESLARPGGNLTGFTGIVDELAGKRLEVRLNVDVM
jgi:ABC-type uncharacterized transport system substrate-binding protein